MTRVQRFVWLGIHWSHPLCFHVDGMGSSRCGNKIKLAKEQLTASEDQENDSFDWKKQVNHNDDDDDVPVQVSSYNVALASYRAGLRSPSTVVVHLKGCCYYSIYTYR